MKFFTEGIFLTELNILKGDRNIYFKSVTFYEKKKIFRKSYIFFLKIYIFSTQFCYIWTTIAHFDYELKGR